MSDLADFHLDGPFDQDRRLTYYNTELSLAGWALLPDSNCRLAVYAGDLLLGSITPSEFRADLILAFPWLAPDATAGFNTTIQLPPGLVDDNPGLQIRVAMERDGRVVKESFWGVTKSIPRLEFYIDEARIANGKLLCDQRNARFYGWAVCQEAIEGISADLGENLRITAQYGITRPDVFAVRPNNPNGSSAGFSLFVPLVPADCESIEFSITLASGTVLVRRFELSVQTDAVAVPSFRRLSFAETHFLSSRLASPAPRPCFVILPQPISSETTPSPNVELQATIASILVIAKHGIQPKILIHADCLPAAAPVPAGCDSFRSGTDLSRELGGNLDEWIICLREGDTIAPGLGLFLHNWERSQNSFAYWDETAVSPRRARTLYKVPGAPFITLLNHDFIGRGWAVRISDALLENLAAGDIASYLLSIPLAAFRTPAACAHIPEVLSRHVYQADDLTPGRAETAARNHVLAEIELLYGPLSLQSGHLTLACADADLPRISVIIPTIGTAGRVITCLRGLRDGTDYPNLEIVVVDHMPFAPQFLPMKRQIRNYADQVLSMIGPFNWSRFNNFGAALATGSVFLFLNDDIEVRDPQWLRRLLPYVSQASVGAVAPSLLTPQGSIQSCGVSLFDGEGAARNDYAFTDAQTAIGEGLNLVPRNCTSLLGAAILTRREIFTAMGGFEEALPLTFNDLEYHMKLHAAGYQVAVIPTAALIHFEKTSRALIQEKPLEDLYDRKWRRRHLLGDPFIHPAFETDTGMYKVHREPGDIIWSRNVAALRQDVQRILVLRLDHIGDFTLSIPAFRLLRGTFPNAKIDVVVGPWNRTLAERLQLFDRVMLFNFYAERSGDGRELDESASRQIFRSLLADQSYDLAIDLRLDGDTRQLLTLVDAEFRAGFSEGLLHPWLDISLEWAGNLRSWRKNASATDEVRRLIMTVADRFPITTSLDENQWQPGRLPRYMDGGASANSADTRTEDKTLPPRRLQVIIHPFAGNEIKMWPAAKWRDLVALLHADGINVLMVGAANDAIRDADTVQSLTQAGAVNALGVYSLDELLDVIAAADCFIGCDSGPKHLAASAGIPVIGLQSSFVDPVMWGPMNAGGVSLIRNVQCGPCYIDVATKCPRQVACMTQISVADVYSQAHRVLTTPILADRPVTYPEIPDAGERLASTGIVLLQLPRPTVNAPLPQNGSVVASNDDNRTQEPAPSPALDPSPANKAGKRKTRVSVASTAARRPNGKRGTAKRAGL